MRADRLLSILLLLQAHGRMSAATLAERLEVSRRTIYRDVDALGAAGVPVVIDQGRNGGVSLLAGWRTDVTGLTESELSSLLAFASSGPASDLGLGTDLDQAARKVAAAAGHAHAFAGRVLVDNDPWSAPRRVPPHLARVQDALWADRLLFMRYRRADGTLTERTVEPYGLVAKNGVWYLLAGGDTGLRTFRVSRIEEAEVGAEFERPVGFDLEREWSMRTRLMQAPPPIHVTVRADPVEAPTLYRMAAGYIVAVAGNDLTLAFPSVGAAAAFLSSFGEDDAVEVVGPEEVRAQLGRIGRRLVERYSTFVGSLGGGGEKGQVGRT